MAICWERAVPLAFSLVLFVFVLFFCSFFFIFEPRHDTKKKKRHMRPGKTQISWASTQSDQSLRCVSNWVAKDPSFLHADSED